MWEGSLTNQYQHTWNPLDKDNLKGFFRKLTNHCLVQKGGI